MPPFSPTANAVTKTSGSFAGPGEGGPAIMETAARTNARARGTGLIRGPPRYRETRNTRHDGLPAAPARRDQSSGPLFQPQVDVVGEDVPGQFLVHGDVQAVAARPGELELDLAREGEEPGAGGEDALDEAAAGEAGGPAVLV